jgi:type 1 fimbria pilin
MKITLKIFFLLAIATFAGCYYDSEERLYPSISGPCDDTVVTFSGTVNTILQPCLTCHSNSDASSSGNGIKLQDYSDVMIVVNNGKMMGAVNHSSGYAPMPDGGGKLPDCEIAQLQKWIDNGSLNN